MSRILLCLSAVLLGSCTTNLASAAELAPASYPLDAISRQAVAGALPCQTGDLDLVSYGGTLLKYTTPVRVYPGFRSSLSAFEQIVDELAREHFGRPPRKLVHFGAYACRPVRGRPGLLSEHALGNALDVAGFEFGPLTKKQRAGSALPKALQRGFQIRVDKHWNAQGAGAPQAAFLRALAARIVARPDIFRVVLGPGYPGHHNHFHLDYAPYRMVALDGAS